MAAGFTHEGVLRGAAPARDGGREDRVVWSRLSTDPGEPNSQQLPDLPGGHLTDGVVKLVPLGPSDTNDYFALAQLPEVIATTVVTTPLTRERIARRCAEARYNWLLGRQAGFTIRDAETDTFAGMISMMCEGVTKQAMFGYDVTRECRGRGFAPRAVRLLTAWAFDVAGVARLVAGTAPDNLASARVLEKAGFTREGFERGRLPRTDGGDGRVDNVGWAILPEDVKPE
jgi:RimJ/RimL family protein N-acetyltransferase